MKLKVFIIQNLLYVMEMINNLNNIYLKCLIIDDEPGAIEGIKHYIEKLDFLEIADTCFSAIDAADILKEKEINLMFLDINMPDLTGFEFLESLDKAPLTILTTAYSEYALDGYRLNVVDYLLKPIAFLRFFQAAQKAKDIYASLLLKQNIESNNNDIYIKQGDSFIRIIWTDILYIESMQNYIKIHLSDKIYIVHQTMIAIEKILPKKVFFRIHKSFLINISHIDSIKGGRIYVNEKELPLSKYRREDLFKLVVNKKLIGK